MTGGVCKFPTRRAMNVLTPRGSNYNKAIAPVTGGKLQDHLCDPWSNEITHNLAFLCQVESLKTSMHIYLTGPHVGPSPTLLLFMFVSTVFQIYYQKSFSKEAKSDCLYFIP